MCIQHTKWCANSTGALDRAYIEPDSEIFGTNCVSLFSCLFHKIYGRHTTNNAIHNENDTTRTNWMERQASERNKRKNREIGRERVSHWIYMISRFANFPYSVLGEHWKMYTLLPSCPSVLWLQNIPDVHLKGAIGFNRMSQGCQTFDTSSIISFNVSAYLHEIFMISAIHDCLLHLQLCRRFWAMETGSHSAPLELLFAVLFLYVNDSTAAKLVSRM